MNTVIKTEGLTKRYGAFKALNDVSLTVNEGEIYGLVGRNGAGKTTFFKCIMGLAKATGGTIEFNDTKEHLNQERKKIGFMISSAFYPYLNGRQNIEYLRKLKGITDKRETDRVLKLVGLDGVGKATKKYSMGMKQRLGLAGAMLGRPPIVILDEPINGLDPQGIADIRNIIKEENEKYDTTFIVSSHILSELDLVATNFGFIEKGVLLQEITRDDLHSKTKKATIIGVDNQEAAKEILSSKLGIKDIEIKDNELILPDNIGKSDEIAKALVYGGIELYKLAPQETTLEEYFINLIGGDFDA